MRALGIDLASDPRNTGFAVVRFRDREATLEELGDGADDDALLAHHAAADATGIDAPFGWPRAFVNLVADHASPGGPPPPAWDTERRDALRFRATDRAVRERLGRWPLSPSSDLIAVPTFRCLGLLDRMGVGDRGGAGRVFETYPAVALKTWGLTSAGYKGPRNRGALRDLLAAVKARLPWLRITREQEEKLHGDDVFDALIAALIARVAWLDSHAGTPPLTVRPSEAERKAARDEGWIILPTPDALERIFPRPGFGV